MHNNIMAAGSKDRPLMLGPGRYSQWRSRFLWYIDTKNNGEGLKKCILNGPYVPTSVLIQAVPAAEGRPAVQQHTAIETVLNMTPENKEHFQSEKEAIFLLLTGIGDEIYSTFTSRDGESMESYYSRFYKLMNELTRNNLQVTTMQVNVQFLQQLQPEWSRFVTIVKQSEKIDIVSYHRLFDILKQFQLEVNDIRAERIAKSANPLALIAAAQPYSDNYYQAPKPQRSNATSSSTRPSASTRHKGKEIAKPITPQSESVSVSDEDSDPEQAQRDKEMQKNLALLAKYFKKLYKPTNNNLRTSSNSRNKTEDTTPRYNNDNQSRQFGNQRTMTVARARETVGSQVVQQTGIQCFNCKGYGHYAKECRKPKRVKDYAYHKEKMMMCKQAEQGVPLQAEQADWLEDTDEEIDEQELEAHYSYMAKIQEVSPEESSSTGQPLEQVQNHDESNVYDNVRRIQNKCKSINDTYVLEKDDSNVIPDSSNICTNDNQVDQNAAECVDERVALANLIANLTLDTEENKTILKQLKKANASLTQELEKCKTNHDETSRALGEATSSRDSCLIALQTKHEILLTLFQTIQDETPKVLKDFLTMIQRNLQAQVITVLTDRGTEFLNKTLHAYFKDEGIKHQTSTPRTPEQNGQVATASAILRTDQSSYRLMESTAYHLNEDRNPSIKHHHILSKGYRVYNKRTRLIVESIHIKFDEIKEMMSDHNSSDLAPQRQEMSVENVSSGLVPQGQKASDYDNSTDRSAAPHRQNVVPTAEKTIRHTQWFRISSSVLYMKNITIQHTVLAEDNNNNLAPGECIDSRS
ncbi:retrovirus-related pol polyprotein from transposon TNT 1-94 [Tanacetum coccineum]